MSAKYVSLPDMSDVCLTFAMQFYNGLHSIVRQMSDVSLPHFADTAFSVAYEYDKQNWRSVGPE